MNEIAQPLARFVTESSKISGSSANSDLFKPNKDLVLSVFRIDDLEYSEIRDIGIDVVKRHRTARRLHGWGKFPASAVDEIGLKLVDDDNPPRHSYIEGWPPEAARRKFLQKELALRSKTIKFDAPVEVKS